MFRRAVTGVGALVVLGLMASGRAPVGVASGERSPAVAAVVIALALGAALAVRFPGAELAIGTAVAAVAVGVEGGLGWLTCVVALVYALGVSLRSRRVLSVNGVFAGGVVAGAGLCGGLVCAAAVPEWGWTAASAAIALAGAGGAACVFRVGAGAPRIRAVWSARVAAGFAIGVSAAGIVAARLTLVAGPAAVVLLVAPILVAAAAHRSATRLLGVRADTIDVLVGAIEAKDPYTGGHSVRVSEFAQMIGAELRFNAAALDHLGRAALLHDIGKLAVPSALLNKPGRLTAQEYETVKRHNDVCVEILAHVDFLRTVVPTASDRYGHFDTDRSSRHIEAREGRVVAVADAFDAMTSTRAYRRALSQDVAVKELRDKAGSQFDPDCVEALVRALSRAQLVVGAGHESNVVDYRVAPPEVGVGSAGLGQLAS